MPNLDSGKWSIFDKAENLRATLDAGFNHYHQDHGALQRSNDIYIFIYTHKKFSPTWFSFWKRCFQKRNFWTKTFSRIGSVLTFLDIKGCLIFPSVNSYQLFFLTRPRQEIAENVFEHLGFTNRSLESFCLAVKEANFYHGSWTDWPALNAPGTNIYCLSQIVVLVENVWAPSVL